MYRSGSSYPPSSLARAGTPGNSSDGSHVNPDEPFNERNQLLPARNLTRISSELYTVIPMVSDEKFDPARIASGSNYDPCAFRPFSQLSRNSEPSDEPSSPPSLISKSLLSKPIYDLGMRRYITNRLLLSTEIGIDPKLTWTPPELAMANLTLDDDVNQNEKEVGHPGKGRGTRRQPSQRRTTCSAKRTLKEKAIAGCFRAKQKAPVSKKAKGKRVAFGAEFVLN